MTLLVPRMCTTCWSSHSVEKRHISKIALEPLSQIYRRSALVKLLVGRLGHSVNAACLAAVAAASGESRAELIPTASATTAAREHARAEITTAQFFDNYDAGARRELEIVAS